MTLRVILACTLLAAALAPAVDASPIQIQSVPCKECGNPPGCEGLGFFTGTLDYDAETSTLMVRITNSNETAAGGKLVAFAFNNPGNRITGVTIGTASNFTNVLGARWYRDSVAAHPMGPFDIGASVTREWLGGGSPNPGLARGTSITIAFRLTGYGLSTLTTQSFIDAVNEDGEFFAARFRGFHNGGGDKVRAMVVPNPVPEPGSALLLSAGVLALIAGRWRRPARG